MTPLTLPELSALVVIPDSFATVRQTISALAAQTHASRIELVFVLADAGIEIPSAELAPFHSWQSVVSPFVSIGHAYAAGVQQARAPIVALTEDHSFPAPNWAETLIAAYARATPSHPIAAVGPAVRDANPETLVSNADFWIAYGKWAAPAPSTPVDYVPGHNSSYLRAALLTYGARLPILMDSETVLHWDLRSQGYTLWLAGETNTAHLQFSRFGPWLRAQLYTGRLFAIGRADHWSVARRALYALAAPLIPFVRWWRVRTAMRRAATHPLTLYALILLGLTVDAAGQALGYALRSGPSTSDNLEHEFHRVGAAGAHRRGLGLPAD